MCMSEARVLIVDDDPAIRRLLRRCFAGWQVSEAADGRQGWDAAHAQRPDLIVMDRLMPGLSGDELLHRLRGEPDFRDTPIIMITARDDDVAEAYRHGADHYITKPFKMEEVRAIAERALQRHEPIERIRPMMEAMGEGFTKRDWSRMGDAMTLLGEMQRRMLPQDRLEIPGFEIGADLHPSFIASGDFYDLLPRRDRTLGIVVGDVSGKGPAAAYFMVMVRTMLRTRRREHHSLLEDMQALNEMLVEETPGDWFVTLIYLALNPQTATALYANAGHPPLLVYNAKTGRSRQLPNNGPGLGIFKQLDLRPDELRLEPHDIVVAYTDGILDAVITADVAERYQWLEEAVAARSDLPADQLAHRVLEAARTAGSDEHKDDLTVLVIKRH